MAIIYNQLFFATGERVLLLEKNSTVAVTPSQSKITLPCSVSNPAANVTLMKLLPPSSVSESDFYFHPHLWLLDQKMQLLSFR